MNKKKFIITGITSGFGHLLTQELLSEGHYVVGIARGGESRLLGSSLEPFLKDKSQFKVIDLDLNNKDQFSQSSKEALAFLNDSVDVLINNAGLGYIKPFFEQSNQEIEEQINVNFIHLMYWTKLFFQPLKKSQGRILQISSIAGLSSFPFYGTYAASKHALEAASEALYYELKPFNIQVALIEPGGFQTSFTKKALKNEPYTNTEFSKSIQKLNSFFLSSKSKWTKNPNAVVKLIKYLSFKNKIKLRYLIGSDAYFLYYLKLFLPENFRVKIIAYLYKKKFT